MFPSKTSFTSYFAVVLDGKTINLGRETRPDSYWSSFPSVDEIPVQDVFPVRLNMNSATHVLKRASNVVISRRSPVV